ncbi:DUF5321 domain-containing protein [Aspergillus homomorphus CBS 101889]|uniref:Uncharacterized protein n=1 Tax=Aspergillus homomorphus (strain CBS 101889) TaxID=1450537 RepID=A0A395HZ84_ASPHC|nr:hypothetical protein BO97DRAFT_424418 [Aspergillus homomorphus CBS 101889]RAL12785.1 hypothetical protein BO97DRAFT_424418 [Aspergillus homomorphus CBS 101889]
MSSLRPSLRMLTRVHPIRSTAAAQFTAPSTQPLRTTRPYSNGSRFMPRFLEADVWTTFIPAFIRIRFTRGTKPYTPKSKEWNPASFYIIIFILIGSQAIRMIALKNDYADYTRSTDAKIRLLREVIEKVNKGEVVDVEKLLGTGNESKEREWEEVLREIEEEDSLWHRRSSTRDSAPQQPQEEVKEETAKTVAKDPVIPAETPTNAEPPADGKTKRRVNFF